MRVLMFGWEFPPHIAGGLGTACYGMTKGLAYNDVDVLFVMPSASGDEDESAVKIINASDVAIDTVSETVDEFLGKVQFVHIGPTWSLMWILATSPQWLKRNARDRSRDSVSSMDRNISFPASTVRTLWKRWRAMPW